MGHSKLKVRVGHGSLPMAVFTRIGTARIGTAAWTIPKDFASPFPPSGSHLERYASQLNAVEINSSFYRHHRPATYERWAATVPADFRFSVKLSKIFTHEQRLDVDKVELAEVLAGPLGLGEKLGMILVQLPPSLNFEAKVFERFVKLLRKNFSGGLVCEPRHKSWNESTVAARIFKDYNVGRVIADPDPLGEVKGERTFLSQLEAAAGTPIYLRLHGSPQIYKSDYEDAILNELTTGMKKAASLGLDIWCIFDNTTFGFATKNAVDLLSKTSAL